MPIRPLEVSSARADDALPGQVCRQRAGQEEHHARRLASCPRPLLNKDVTGIPPLRKVPRDPRCDLLPSNFELDRLVGGFRHSRIDPAVSDRIAPDVVSRIPMD